MSVGCANREAPLNQSRGNYLLVTVATLYREQREKNVIQQLIAYPTDLPNMVLVGFMFSSPTIRSSVHSLD